MRRLGAWLWSRRFALAGGMDNLTYRARRILGSALAWVLAGGDPARIAGT